MANLRDFEGPDAVGTLVRLLSRLVASGLGLFRALEDSPSRKKSADNAS